MTATLTRNSIRDRIDRGVEMLDDNRPDWRDRIDPTRLDMLDGFRCILGQVYDEGPFAVLSGYQIGMRELGLHDEVLIVNGRMIDAEEYYGFHPGERYAGNPDAFTAEWLRRLS